MRDGKRLWNSTANRAGWRSFRYAGLLPAVSADHRHQPSSFHRRALRRAWQDWNMVGVMEQIQQAEPAKLYMAAR
jgi:hypothetical protein